MKIALYKNIEYGYTAPLETDQFENNNDYVRLSASIDVDFEMLSQKSVVNKEIAVIDSMITTVMAESENKLTELKRRKAELLAIGSGK